MGAVVCPLRLSPQVCSEAAAPGDCARLLAHGGSPSQDSALSLHGHSLPPPSPSTLWLRGMQWGGVVGMLDRAYGWGEDTLGPMRWWGREAMGELEGRG